MLFTEQQMFIWTLFKIEKICTLSTLVILPCFNHPNKDTKQLSIKKLKTKTELMSKTKIGSEKYTRKCLINNGKTVSLTRQGKGATVPPPQVTQHRIPWDGRLSYLMYRVIWHTVHCCMPNMRSQFK